MAVEITRKTFTPYAAKKGEEYMNAKQRGPRAAKRALRCIEVRRGERRAFAEPEAVAGLGRGARREAELQFALDQRKELGWPMGLEPTTTGITTLDSTFELRPPLNARCNSVGLPDKTRTCNPQLRRLVLYPVELRAVREQAQKSMQKPQNLVGARGFEPPTSCSQSKRATRLRHAPKKAANDTLSAPFEQRERLATGVHFCYKSASLF